MSSNRVLFATTGFLVCLSFFLSCQAVLADDARPGHIDWCKLNMSPAQSQQIQSLEAQWAHDYNEISPAIVDEQHKLTRLLADHNSDPVEIMALQQSLARKKEQLNGIATANYLRKRQLLNENQQHNLELMIRQSVALHQRQLNPGSQTEVMPDRVQDLMQRVRNCFWPAQQDR